MKAWLWVVVVVVAAAGAWWYTSGDGNSAPSPELERTAIVERGDLVVSITATGIVEPIEQVDVKSKASGEIMVLPVQEGDYVQRGDLIARLDRTTAQNDFDQATADNAVARVTRDQREKDLRRQQDLFDRGLVAESVLDEARLAYEQANAQLVRTHAILSTAKERLEETEIRAPIDGVVLTRPVEVGQIISSGTTTVTGGTLLCTIAKMSKVHVVADVDETDIGKVAPDLGAMINADAYPDVNLQGRVLRIAPLAKVEQNVTMFEVTVLVDNDKSLLKAGMNATVEVVMNRSDGTLLIPTRAVEYRAPERPANAEGGRGADSGGGARAEARMRSGSPSAGGHPAAEGGHGGRLVPWVQVRRDGQLEWTRIRTGLSNLDRIEVLDGLAEGDTVVYSLVSGAMLSREAFRDRMRSRSSMTGMRRGE